MQSPFLVDENCAQVTKWLRFYGLDALEVRGLSDSDVSDQAVQQNRILITRDQTLCRTHPGPLICLSSDNLSEQLKMIFQKTGLPAESLWFSRCVQCNAKLELLSENEFKDNPQIPPKVLATHKTFWRCPSCGNIYWEGSHYLRAQEFLRFNTKDL